MQVFFKKKLIIFRIFFSYNLYVVFFYSFQIINVGKMHYFTFLAVFSRGKTFKPAQIIRKVNCFFGEDWSDI